MAPLKSRGSTYTDPIQQASVLNKQFHEFESVFSKHKALSVKFLAELELWFQELNPQNIKQMPEISITIKGTESLLKISIPTKPQAQMKFPPDFYEIAHILKNVFRSSLHSGIVPDDWKSALVAPVYKKVPNVNPATTDPFH